MFDKEPLIKFFRPGDLVRLLDDYAGIPKGSELKVINPGIGWHEYCVEFGAEYKHVPGLLLTKLTKSVSDRDKGSGASHGSN